MNLKTIGKNTIIYAMGNICLRAASFLLIPIYTHWMAIEEFGVFANLLLTIQMMVYLISVGAQTGLIRYFKDFDERGQAKELIGSTLALTMGSSILVTTVSCVLLNGFFTRILGVPDAGRLILLTCLAATGQAVCIEMLAYYRARDKAVQFIMFSFVIIPFLIGLNVYFLYLRNWGVYGALSAYTISYVAMAGVLLLRIIPEVGFAVSWPTVLTMLRFGFPLVFSMGSWLVMGSSAIYFLSYYASLESAAIYSLGQKFGQIASIVLLLPFQLAYEPVVFANTGKDHLKEIISSIMTYFFLAFLVTALAILAGTWLILPLVAPPEYADAFLIVLFILPAVLFEGLYSLGATMIQIVNKTHLLGVGAFCFVSMSLLANYLLIPSLGWLGAVISLNLTYTTAGLAILIVGIRNYPVVIERRRLVTLAAMLFSTIGIFFLIRNQDIFAFVGIVALTITLIMLFLFKSGFFTNQEKAFFKKCFLRLSWI